MRVIGFAITRFQAPCQFKIAGKDAATRDVLVVGQRISVVGPVPGITPVVRFIAAVDLVCTNEGFQGAAALDVADTFNGNDQIAGFVAFRADVHTGVIDAQRGCISNIL